MKEKRFESNLTGERSSQHLTVAILLWSPMNASCCALPGQRRSKCCAMCWHVPAVLNILVQDMYYLRTCIS